MSIATATVSHCFNINKTARPVNMRRGIRSRLTTEVQDTRLCCSPGFSSFFFLVSLNSISARSEVQSAPPFSLCLLPETTGNTFQRRMCVALMHVVGMSGCAASLDLPGGGGGGEVHSAFKAVSNTAINIFMKRAPCAAANLI